MISEATRGMTAENMHNLSSSTHHMQRGPDWQMDKCQMWNDRQNSSYKNNGTFPYRPLLPYSRQIQHSRISHQVTFSLPDQYSYTRPRGDPYRQGFSDTPLQCHKTSTNHTPTSSALQQFGIDHLKSKTTTHLPGAALSQSDSATVDIRTMDQPDFIPIGLPNKYNETYDDMICHAERLQCDNVLGSKDLSRDYGCSRCCSRVQYPGSLMPPCCSTIHCRSTPYSVSLSEFLETPRLRTSLDYFYSLSLHFNRQDVGSYPQTSGWYHGENHDNISPPKRPHLLPDNATNKHRLPHHYGHRQVASLPTYKEHCVRVGQSMVDPWMQRSGTGTMINHETMSQTEHRPPMPGGGDSIYLDTPGSTSLVCLPGGAYARRTSEANSIQHRQAYPSMWTQRKRNAKQALGERNVLEDKHKRLAYWSSRKERADAKQREFGSLNTDVLQRENAVVLHADDPKDSSVIAKNVDNLSQNSITSHLTTSDENKVNVDRMVHQPFSSLESKIHYQVQSTPATGRQTKADSDDQRSDKHGVLVSKDHVKEDCLQSSETLKREQDIDSTKYRGREKYQTQIHWGEKSVVTPSGVDLKSLQNIPEWYSSTNETFATKTSNEKNISEQDIASTDDCDEKCHGSATSVSPRDHNEGKIKNSGSARNDCHLIHPDLRPNNNEEEGNTDMINTAAVPNDDDNQEVDSRGNEVMYKVKRMILDFLNSNKEPVACGSISQENIHQKYKNLVLTGEHIEVNREITNLQSNTTGSVWHAVGRKHVRSTGSISVSPNRTCTMISSGCNFSLGNDVEAIDLKEDKDEDNNFVSSDEFQALFS